MIVIHANTKPFGITSVPKLILGYKGVNGDPYEDIDEFQRNGGNHKQLPSVLGRHYLHYMVSIVVLVTVALDSI